ncbi:MAG: hypothetical protein H6835_09285 [Planctomycetes bacterium]|nr:hypothetical protein [Planctomycetota bacterium]
MPRCPHLRAAIGALLVSHLAAQTTWVVPDGTDPDVYIAQASPGDTLQLSGEHPGFTLDRGLTVLGPADVRIYTPPFTDTAVHVVLPPGQRARFIGVRFIGFISSSGPGSGGDVHVDGDVSFEDCYWGTQYVSGVAVPASLTVSSGAVQVVRCTIYGSYQTVALNLTGGHCSIADSVLNGANFLSGWSFVPQPAVRQAGGTLVASHVTMLGGYGGSYFFGTLLTNDAAPGMEQVGGVAYLSDSELRGGDGRGFSLAKAGPALAGYGQCLHARTQLVDGVSSLGLTGPTTGDVSDPAMVGVSMTTPLRLAQPYAVVGTAGSSLGLFATIGTFDLAMTQGAPLVEPLYGTPGTHVVLTVATPAAGQQVATNGSVPNMPALVGATVWFQCLQLDGAAVRLSSVVGGTIL